MRNSINLPVDELIIDVVKMCDVDDSTVDVLVTDELVACGEGDDFT